MTARMVAEQLPVRRARAGAWIMWTLLDTSEIREVE
jgi:hypothetical protein